MCAKTHFVVIFQPDCGSYPLFNLQGVHTERTCRLTRMNMESLNNADIEFILWNNEGNGGEQLMRVSNEEEMSQPQTPSRKCA